MVKECGDAHAAAQPRVPQVPRHMPPISMDDPRALPVHTVVITAADFNGRQFDGQPFKSVYPIMAEDWFLEAIRSHDVLVQQRAGTDYAWFGVFDEYGNVTWAGPGDYITLLEEGRYMVVPQKLASQFGIAPMVGE